MNIILSVITTLNLNEIKHSNQKLYIGKMDCFFNKQIFIEYLAEWIILSDPITVYKRHILNLKTQMG